MGRRRAEVNIYAKCDVCGGPLDVEVDSDSDGIYVAVPPCQKCMEKAKDQAYTEGKESEYGS